MFENPKKIQTYDKDGGRVEISRRRICKQAKYVFVNGQCHALAIAAHRAWGYPIWSGHQVPHMAVVRDDGYVFDIQGWHHPADFLREWSRGCDDLAECGALHTHEASAYNEAYQLGYVEPDMRAAKIVFENLCKKLEEQAA